MINLGSWMNGILIGWGIDPKIANTFDEMIIAALLVILAIGVGLPVPSDLCRQHEKARAAYTLSMGFVASQT